MKTIHLKEFIRTGSFGPLAIGSTKSEVVAYLGIETDFADSGESQIINYGWYEFFYWTETGKVFGIQNDHLQADCVNHDEMIDFKNELWILDKWFLQEGKNITCKEVKQFLIEENIPFKFEPPYKTTNENVIKCIKSSIVIDFCKEYAIVELDEMGEFKDWKEMIAENEDDYVLNGIRVFRY